MDETIQRQRKAISGSAYMIARIEGVLTAKRRYQEDYYKLQEEHGRVGRRL